MERVAKWGETVKERYMTVAFAKVAAKEAVKFAAIAVAVGGLYYYSLMASPSLARSEFSGFFGKTFRWGNVLRGLILEHPAVALGIEGGAKGFDVSTGTGFSFAYLFTEPTMLLLGLGAWAWNKKTKGKIAFLIISVYILLSGINTAFNIAVREVAKTGFTAMVVYNFMIKIVSRAVIIYAGYFGWKGIKKGYAKITTK